MSVSSWPFGWGCPNYFNAMFIFAALKNPANKDDPCVETLARDLNSQIIWFIWTTYVLCLSGNFCFSLTSGPYCSAVPTQDYRISVRIKTAAWNM